MADWSETPKWLMPSPTDEDREFWEGARRGELRIQRCNLCNKHQHYPRYLCSHCGADNHELSFVTASGLGAIYSFTVIRKNGVPPLSERVPFVVAAIDLDETGARILATMPTLSPDDARVGMRVRAAFRPIDDAIAFVDFQAVE